MEAERTIPVCYRHPDRETRLACTHCDRPVCWDCVTPAPVGQRCPECARDTGPRIRKVRRDTAPVSMGVIGVAVAVFVLGMLAPAVGRELFLWFGQHNASVLAGDSYRVVTAGFLHAGFTHILFNMWALSAFGPPLEREAGSTAFGGMYLASLLWGGVAYLWLGQPGGFAVGASGAIFGLFGAWTAIAMSNRHTALGQAQLRQMLVLLGINAALPILVPQIAWQAHLGGFLAGFLLGVVWSALRGHERATMLRAATGYGLAALAGLALLLT